MKQEILLEIKPDTNYLMFIGDKDFVPNEEQLNALQKMVVPHFAEKNSKVLLISGAVVGVRTGVVARVQAAFKVLFNRYKT